MPSETRTELSPLKLLRLLMEAVEYDAMLIEKSPAQPYEQLFVAVPLPQREEPVAIEMSFLEDLVATAAQQAGAELERDEAHTLQFYLRLPLGVPADRLRELAQLMLLFNRVALVGHFGVNLQDGFYLRYAVMKESPQIHGRVVVEVIDKMRYTVQHLLPWLEAYLAGEQTLARIEAELDQRFGAGGGKA